jgi:transposase
MTKPEKTSGKSPRRRFDAAFKREAVELGRRIGIPKASADLGITESNLRSWAKAVDRLGNQAFLPVKERTDLEAENRRLREENRVLKMEREVLKKAATFFAKDAE